MQSPMIVRPAAVAGLFYPDEPRTLAATLDALLAEAPAPGSRALPKALVVPHAGYVYSGPVAASAFATLRPHAARIARVVLLGPSHRVAFDGLALPDADALATPLGPIAIDRAALAAIPWVPRSEPVHRREHSLEVELPFVARTLPGVGVVPLAVGRASARDVASVLEALWGGPETIVVVSSDLSHHLPYEVAREVDADTARRVLALDAGLDHERACGATPLAGLLFVAREKGLVPTLLDLRNSGDTAGTRGEVVGYGSFAFYDPERD
jgi:AmmeMemoRadiSam system protein B